MKSLILTLCTTAVLSLSSAAHAHMLVCQCASLADDLIRCTGGFAHGSGAQGVVVDVIGSNEQVLLSGRFDERSTFSFRRPEGDFYVLMDVGAGHTLEVPSTAIRPAL